MPIDHVEIPWEIAPEHQGSQMHAMLTTAIRLQSGAVVGAHERADFDQWLRDLRAADAVVHYEAETQEGWFYVPRRRGVDEGLVREPVTGR